MKNKDIPELLKKFLSLLALVSKVNQLNYTLVFNNDKNVT